MDGLYILLNDIIIYHAFYNSWELCNQGINCWISFHQICRFHPEAAFSSWRCCIISRRFDHVRSLDSYLSRFVKRLPPPIIRALIPPVFSVLYCRCWPSLKPFNPPKQQEKETEVERGAAGMKAVALKLISRPLTNLSDTGGAKGQCIYSASGAVDKLLNGTRNHDSVCAVFHFKLGEGEARSSDSSSWGLFCRLAHCFSHKSLISFHFSLGVCCSPACFLSSPTVVLSAGMRMTSNWHVNWWKEKALREMLSVFVLLWVLVVFLCV